MVRQSVQKVRPTSRSCGRIGRVFEIVVTGRRTTAGRSWAELRGVTLPNLTEMIATAYNLPYPQAELLKLNGERCVHTGQPLAEGYRLQDVISSATNDFGVYRGLHGGYISVATARCYNGSNPKSNPPCMICSKSMVVIGETGYQPLISDIAAQDQGRPYWSQLVRSIWVEDAGQSCVIILSTDTKTRVWHQPHVRVGVLGHSTPVTIYNPDWPINRTVAADWPEMLADLETAETIVSAGFWNSSLKSGLFTQKKGVESIPFPQTWEWERELQTLRPKSHWPIIQLIARERTDLKWKPEQTKKPSLSPKQPQLALF